MSIYVRALKLLSGLRAIIGRTRGTQVPNNTSDHRKAPGSATARVPQAQETMTSPSTAGSTSPAFVVTERLTHHATFGYKDGLRSPSTSSPERTATTSIAMENPSARSTSALESLPTEVLQEIAPYLPAKDLKSARLASKQLAAATLRELANRLPYWFIHHVCRHPQGPCSQQPVNTLGVLGCGDVLECQRIFPNPRRIRSLRIDGDENQGKKFGECQGDSSRVREGGNVPLAAEPKPGCDDELLPRIRLPCLVRIGFRGLETQDTTSLLDFLTRHKATLRQIIIRNHTLCAPNQGTKAWMAFLQFLVIDFSPSHLLVSGLKYLDDDQSVAEVRTARRKYHKKVFQTYAHATAEESYRLLGRGMEAWGLTAVQEGMGEFQREVRRRIEAYV